MKLTRNNRFAALSLSASSLPSAAFTIAFTALLASHPAQAAALTWDTVAGDGATITAGPGAWNIIALNTVWNNAGANVIWNQTNTTTALNNAIFAGMDAAANTYIVTLGAQMAADGLTFNSDGYQLAGTAGFHLKGASTSTVAAGKTVNIACPHLGANSVFNWIAGTGATVNISGNISGSQQPRFCGPGTYNLTGVNNPSVPYFLAPVFQTAGSMTPTSSFFVGNLQTVNAVVYDTGSYTLGDGSSPDSTATLSFTADNAVIGRNGGSGTLIIRNGGTANFGLTGTKGNLLVPRDTSAVATPNKGKLEVQGGILNVGAIGGNQAQIQLSGNGSTATQTGDMLQSGGTVNTNGITFGGTGTYVAGATASLTMTGGTLYVGSIGINEGAGHPTDTITLSGGTVGALANWTSAMPMTLANTPGDVTFQCANSAATSFDITLTQTLTGLGGLKKTGLGKLTLSGVNDYSGTTLVSNGTLTRVTGATPSLNGPVTLDGSAFSPILSVTVTNANQYWQIGKLTCAAGTVTADIQYGVVPPSTTVPPVEVAGDIDFTVTPLVVVGGSSIANGTYPLIHYTGTLTGTAPTAASLPGYITGSSIVHDPGTKTISLVVTASSFIPALSWRVGDGVWDINTTANWTQLGGAVKFNNGNAVTLDDTASGTSPITIALSATVTPFAVTANNATKDYIIAGSGSIAGTGSVNVLGSSSLTLSGMNTYSGGTNLSAGTLKIDNGGDASSSAIGTGPLTINAGTLDNTSPGGVTLQPVIPQTWNGNFSYLGSINNLNMGTGSVSLTNNISLSVAANTFTVGGVIDGAFTLSKTGAGALTLPVANTFSGGLTLSAGRLNVADPGSAGSGTLRINGGEIDNTSGVDMSLSPSTVVFGSAFTFVGTHSLTLSAPSAPGAGISPVTINVVSNTLTLDGEITLANAIFVKNGLGTLSLSGSTANGSGGLIVNAGRVNLDKTSGSAIGRSSTGVTVNATGLLVITGESGNQIIDSSTSPFTPVNLVSGTFDLNGRSERVDSMTISGDGILRNSAAASLSTLSLRTANVLTLTGSANFEATEVDGFLSVTGPIVGSGALRKTGAGTLTLSDANTYNGPTTVEVGTLAVTGSLGATAVTVSSAATLSGNGNIGGDVTIDSGATHALAVAADVGSQVTRAITGTLTLTAGNLLDLTAAAAPAAGEYVLATATTNIIGAPTTIDYNGIVGLVSVDTVSNPKRLLLTVAAAGGYSAWAAINAIGSNPDQDKDGDGVNNATEYVLGGTVGTNDLAKLPNISTPGGNMLFTFERDQDSDDGNTTVTIQVGTTLAAWPDNYTVGTDTAGSTVGVAVLVDSPVSGTDTVTLSILQTPDTKKFARLKVVVTP